MTVADVAIYVAILGTIGIVPLAVTTSLTINFLRKPPAGKPIVGVCRLIKVGRTLIVGEVALYSRGSQDMVAHAVGTYSVPPVDRDPQARARSAVRVPRPGRSSGTSDMRAWVAHGGSP